ncbi:MAG: hypothetical protein ACOZAL_01720 [Patescibacteria group bacterium]
MDKHILKWHDPEFQKEVKILYDKLVDMCTLWGFLFGSRELVYEGRLLFAVTHFPERHPELKDLFEKVVFTLIGVAAVWEDEKFIIRPEINTIYTYYSGGKHDLITPIIKALAHDCFKELYSPFRVNYAMN